MVLWYLSLMGREPPFPFNRTEFSRSMYHQLVFPSRVEIGIFFGFTLIIVATAVAWVPQARVKKKIIDELLQQIISEVFRDNPYNNRITIYRLAGAATTFAVYVRSLAVNWTAYHRKQALWYHVVRDFPKPLDKYLIAYARRGKPNEDRSLTFFRAARNDAEVDGIVSFVWLSEIALQVHLPDIRQVDLTEAKTVTDLPEQHREAVAQYLKDGKVEDLSRLKTMNRLSKHFFASLLLDIQAKRWGVLIYDSDADNPVIADEALKERLVSYGRTIETVLKQLSNKKMEA